jgi:hypothetical protein
MINIVANLLAAAREITGAEIRFQAVFLMGFCTEPRASMDSVVPNLLEISRY